MSQLTFDIDELIAEANPAPPRPPYSGRAPLRFTVDFYTLDEYDEAIEELRHVAEWHGTPGWYTYGFRHHWHRGFSGGSHTLPGHQLEFIMADLRCNCLLLPPYGYDTRYCYCVGDLIHQVLCETCRWHLIGDYTQCVAAMHDHVFPGWRDLPVVPAEVRSNGDGDKKERAWVAANYPKEWGTPGAPMITERTDGATRSVPGRSPWKGFDIAASALDVWLPA